MHGQPLAASQRCAAEIASSRKPSLAMDSMASPTKAWISSACASFSERPRAQIKQKALVERAGGGAVAAGDIVGENFQFRLVVGLGLVGQQQRPRHHLGVGLLRLGTDDDAALKHRMAAVVDHGAEDLAAGAVR